MNFLTLLLANLILTCNILQVYASKTTDEPAKITRLPVNVVKVMNHDQNSFTQGLYDDHNIRFESSGGYGKSFIRRYDTDGQKTQKLAPHYFAEGLTVIGNTLYLLTWKAETLLLFDKNSLMPKGSLRYQGQGWGLTHNTHFFIMSNGSNRLFFRNLNTFAIERTLIVNKLDQLNELEYVDGIIWANRWYDDNIYAIDANTGCVLGLLDVSELREQSIQHRSGNVTNGIAYQRSNNTLLITGKNWSKQFVIQLPKLHVNDASC